MLLGIGFPLCGVQHRKKNCIERQRSHTLRSAHDSRDQSLRSLCHLQGAGRAPQVAQWGTNFETCQFGTRAEHFVARVKIVRENLQHFIVTYTASSCSSSVSFYKAHDIHKIYTYINIYIHTYPTRHHVFPLCFSRPLHLQKVSRRSLKTPAELWGFKQSLMMWWLLRSWNLRCQRARHEVGSLQPSIAEPIPATNPLPARIAR